jgi:eukaryotic-like serine/threonine-protein kinase
MVGRNVILTHPACSPTRDGMLDQTFQDCSVAKQTVVAHRGLNGNSPLGALAHLQIGRAYAMSGDPAKARAAYQDFLTLWKDADPGIRILKQAKAEYAKLQ